MKRLLTIAGSDSGGGAGIQQDLKVFTLLGSYGFTVITALTAQNTRGVHGIFEISPEFVKNQLECVIDDIKPHAIKTGMLFNSDIILSISDVLKKYTDIPLIVDPVMVAKGGEELLQTQSISCFIENLLPITDIITPNIPEAQSLSQVKINTLDDMKVAARSIYKKLKKSRICSIVIKGGHLKNNICHDLIYSDNEEFFISSPRLDSKNTHGTGCTFSAALTHYIANEYDIINACKKAKDFVFNAIKNAEDIGGGIGPTNPYSNLEINFQKTDVLEKLARSLEILKQFQSGIIIPEIQTNIGYALYNATHIDHVAAFPGRIIRLYNGVTSVSPPQFGASSHIARIILTVMKKSPTHRSAMNIKLNDSYIENAKRLGYVISSFDRELEPPEIQKKEGATLNWGIEYSLNKSAQIPDLIYDKGAIGKEPVIRIIGTDPIDVVTKALKISDLMK